MKKYYFAKKHIQFQHRPSPSLSKTIIQPQYALNKSDKLQYRFSNRKIAASSPTGDDSYTNNQDEEQYLQQLLSKLEQQIEGSDDTAVPEDLLESILQEDDDENDLLSTQSLPNSKFLEQKYDPIVPPGPVRDELERLLGIRPPENPDDPLTGGPFFDEADAFARQFEETGVFPPIPQSFFGDNKPEPADQFMKRLNKSIEGFLDLVKNQGKRRRFKGSKHKNKTKTENGSSNTITESGEAGRINSDVSPEDADEEEGDAYVEPFSTVTMFPTELNYSVPVPDIPHESLQQIYKAQRVLYILRRAFLESHRPDAGVHALMKYGLLDDSAWYDDPWVSLPDSKAILSYVSDKLTDSGRIDVELDSIFANYYSYTPTVKCCVVIDTFYNIPLPYWYQSYLALHGQPPLTWDVINKGRDPNQPRFVPGDPLEGGLEGLGRPIYPRRECFNDNDTSSSRSGPFHVQWLRQHGCVAAGKQVLVSNQMCCIYDTDSDSDDDSGFVEHGIRVVHSIPYRKNAGTLGAEDAPPLGYALLPSARDILCPPFFAQTSNESDNDIKETKKKKKKKKKRKATKHHNNAMQQEEAIADDSSAMDTNNFQWYAQPSQLPDDIPPPLPRMNPHADIQEYPLSQAEAKQLLQEYLGDKFDKVMSRMPKPSTIRATTRVFKDRGTKWELFLGQYMTVAVSSHYEVDTVSGKVSSIDVQWSWIGGTFPSVYDSYDVFLDVCDLHQDDWQRRQ